MEKANPTFHLNLGNGVILLARAWILPPVKKVGKCQRGIRIILIRRNKFYGQVFLSLQNRKTRGANCFTIV